MNTKKKNLDVFQGTHNGVNYEINNFSFSSEDKEKNNWTYYIALYLDRVPKEFNPEGFWLNGKISNGKYIYYDYHRHPLIANIYFHGGITYYSKIAGFEGEPKVIKIGCDFQHYWDEGYVYDLRQVESEVQKTIDSFKELMPGYKYWCCGNGKLYDLSEGVLIKEIFHSKEYYGENKYYKEHFLLEVDNV